jgi:hypothetical protein
MMNLKKMKQKTKKALDDEGKGAIVVSLMKPNS